MHPEPRARRLTLPELLDEERGVLSRQAALSAGLTQEAWEWRLRVGGPWQSPLPGIAVAHTGLLQFEEQVRAAVQYGGPGAAVSGDALLHLLRPKGTAPTTIDVAVTRQVEPRVFFDPHPRRAIRAADEEGVLFRPHRVSRLAALRHPARDLAQVRVAPGVLHAAAWAVTDRAAEWRVAAAVQQRLVRPEQLRAALAALPRLKRRALVRDVLDDVELGAHARSELDFLAFLRSSGLPLPDRLQFAVRANGKRYLDAWWERQRVAVEVDGAHHMLVTSWDSDVMRSNAIVVAERADRILPLRVTMGNLRHDRAELAAQLRAVLL